MPETADTAVNAKMRSKVRSEVAAVVGGFFHHLRQWVVASRKTQIAVAVILVHANAAGLGIDPTAVLWIGTALVLGFGLEDLGKARGG